jgi:hypothetical protein
VDPAEEADLELIDGEEEEFGEAEAEEKQGRGAYRESNSSSCTAWNAKKPRRGEHQNQEEGAGVGG